MKAAICDDEKSEQQILCKYVQEWAAEKGETAELNCFDNAESFLFSWEDDKEYTVLILDIEMGRMNGMELARQGTADLANVLLHPTSDYLISAATFPTYFLKEGQMEGGAGGALDLEIFGRYFVPALNIKRRFVGQEPFSPTTARYNRQMKEILPRFGVEVTELPRKEQGGAAVSASRVRALLAEDKLEEIQPLVPETTWAFLQSSEGRSVAQRVRQSR